MARVQEIGVTSASPPALEASCAANLPTFAIDEVMAMAQALRPDMKPGVHLVAGKPWTYDANLLLSFEAREAVRAAPADLSDLPDAEIDALVSAGLRRWADTNHRDEAAGDLANRALAEQKRRRAIPVLQPITTAVRQLDPAAWSGALEAAE